MVCWTSLRTSAPSSSHATRCGASLGVPASALKKTLHASEQERPDVARRRQWWQRFHKRLPSEHLVFVDETWTKTNMTRTHGWWRRGERLIAKVPAGAERRSSRPGWRMEGAADPPATTVRPQGVRVHNSR